MFRAALIALPLLLAPVALPAPAAAASAVEAQSRTGENCEQQNQQNRRRGRGIGGFLGGIGSRFGGAAGVITSIMPVGELLGEAIASLLDCREQRQAATATEDAVRGGVGTTTTWRSETRPGHVTGSSTVTSADNSAADGECVTVTDVVIVDGEETRAPKRMCRRPPNNRFVRV